MNQREALLKMRKAGFAFDNVVGFITPQTIDQIARDAALVTAPNSGVPAVFTTYIDPEVVEILTAPTRAREIFDEVKEGDWTISHAMFRTTEAVGHSTPYTDYGNGATADVNINFPIRENYLAQTHIMYGQHEMAVTARTMVNLASDKQRAAATVINVDSNKFYLKGVQGKQIYGLLNEPNLPASITPATINEKTLWKDKTTIQIYNDILALASELFTNSLSRVDPSSDLVLVVSPTTSVLLGKTTEYGKSVKELLNEYFSNLSYVVLPELNSASGGNTVMLVARQVDGAKTGKFGYSDKMRPLNLVPHTSWFEQKYVFGTYGAIIYKPFAIASMAGV